jgi:hypothetical protein
VRVFQIDIHLRAEVEASESREPFEHLHKTVGLNFLVIQVKIAETWDSVIEFGRNQIPIPTRDAETGNVERDNGRISEDRKSPPGGTREKK